MFHEVRQSRTVVDGKYPSWPAHLKQLAAGLLAIYRHRKVDFSIREEVMLLLFCCMNGPLLLDD